MSKLKKEKKFKSRDEYLAFQKSLIQNKINNREMIVGYVRLFNSDDDFEGRGRPVGAMVATRDGVGVSVLNPRDKFEKYFGLALALKRANNGRYINNNPDSVPDDLVDIVDEFEENFVERARKYFGEVNY